MCWALVSHSLVAAAWWTFNMRFKFWQHNSKLHWSKLTDMLALHPAYLLGLMQCYFGTRGNFFQKQQPQLVYSVLATSWCGVEPSRCEQPWAVLHHSGLGLGSGILPGPRPSSFSPLTCSWDCPPICAGLMVELADLSYDIFVKPSCCHAPCWAHRIGFKSSECYKFLYLKCLRNTPYTHTLDILLMCI